MFNFNNNYFSQLKNIAISRATIVVDLTTETTTVNGFSYVAPPDRCFTVDGNENTIVVKELPLTDSPTALPSTLQLRATGNKNKIILEDGSAVVLFVSGDQNELFLHGVSSGDHLRVEGNDNKIFLPDGSRANGEHTFGGVRGLGNTGFFDNEFPPPSNTAAAAAAKNGSRPSSLGAAAAAADNEDNENQHNDDNKKKHQPRTYRAAPLKNRNINNNKNMQRPASAAAAEAAADSPPLYPHQDAGKYIQSLAPPTRPRHSTVKRPTQQQQQQEQQQMFDPLEICNILAGIAFLLLLACFKS